MFFDLCFYLSIITAQLNGISKATWAGLLCENTGITEVPLHAFLSISESNPLVKCSSIPKLNVFL